MRDTATTCRKKGERLARAALLSLTLVVTASPADTGEGRMPVTADELIQRVDRKDWDVIPEMAAVGGAVADALARRSASPDREIRELVLYCLNEVGGLPARTAFLQALHDPDEDVRSRGVIFLHRHAAEADLPRIIGELRANPDHYVREHLALIAGEIDQPRIVPDLKTLLATEAALPVQHNIRLALARLRDAESQEKIFAQLQRPDVPARRQALEDFTYVHDRTQVARLAPLLDDRRDAKPAGPIGLGYRVRVCDLAVNAADRVLDHAFSFVPGVPRRYTDEELHMVRRAIEPRRR
jgi:HEAT repeat protein